MSRMRHSNADQTARLKNCILNHSPGDTAELLAGMNADNSMAFVRTAHDALEQIHAQQQNLLDEAHRHDLHVSHLSPDTSCGLLATDGSAEGLALLSMRERQDRILEITGECELVRNVNRALTRRIQAEQARARATMAVEGASPGAEDPTPRDGGEKDCCAMS